MPGIFGIVDLAEPVAALPTPAITALVRQMADAMKYEPHFVETLIASDLAKACAGYVGPADGATRATDSGAEGVSCLLTGETAADGAAVTHGRCAGVIIDERERTCTIFNDHYGRERIFVHVDGSRVFFASEAKAILAVRPATRSFDETGLAEFLSCGCTIGSHSLYRGIEVLEPGTEITCARPGMTRRRYFSHEDLEALPEVSEAAFVEGFTESLRQAVARAVATGMRTAMSLTGGLDSRMVMAALDAPAGSVPCYTFGSAFRTTGDVAVAARVAACCGQPHRALELGTDFLDGIRRHLDEAIYISDGYLGLSGAAELYVNRQARTIAPARMTGNWGGELMRGVRAFKSKMPKGGFLSPDFAPHIETTTAAFARTHASPVAAALFDQIPYQGFGRYAIERSQLAMRSPFLDDAVVRWLYRAPDSMRSASAGAAAVIGRRPELLSIPTDLGLLGQPESRVRHGIRRALIKAEYLTSHGAPHWMARLSSTLPAPLLETRFLGVDKFQHFRYWTRRQLAGLVRERLTGAAATPLSQWFDTARVAEMVDDHVAGRANYTEEIDRLVTVATAQAQLRRFDAAS